MNVYIPLLTLAGLGLLFAVFSVSVTSLTGPKRYNRAKVDAYECGIEPTPQAIMLFLFNLTIPFVYEWRRGGLEWD